MMNKLTFEEKRKKVLTEMFNDMQFTEIVDAYYKDYTKCDLSNIKFPKNGNTESPESVKQIVGDVFGLDWWQIGGLGLKVIVMTSRNFNDNDKVILDFFKKMGYFAAVHSIDMYKIHNKLYTQWSVIQLEPIYQENYNEIVYKNKFLYHVTPADNVEKILKEGIIPANKNELFNYPKRSYFFLQNYIVFPDLKKYCQKLNDAYIERKEHIKYCALLIDTEKLKDINFYKDPNWVSSVYTQTVIPPEAISVKDYINI